MAGDLSAPATWLATVGGTSASTLAAAACVAVLVVGALVARRVRSRRRRRVPAASLSRLDYLPPVTSRAPRLSWHGSPNWTIGRATTPPPAVEERELVGVRAVPRRAPDDDRTGPVE